MTCTCQSLTKPVESCPQHGAFFRAHETARIEALSHARAVVARIDGKADYKVTAAQARQLARRLEKLAAMKLNA